MQKGLLFPNINFNTQTYQYVYGITSNYLDYYRIKLYLKKYYSIINSICYIKDINYTDIKQKILKDINKNFNCDNHFLKFTQNLEVIKSQVHIIHGDFHLRNILFDYRNWYLLDIGSLQLGVIEKDLAAMGISIYLNYGYDKFIDYITEMKKLRIYNKNILFLEFLNRANRLYKDINPQKEILEFLNNWAEIYYKL